MSWMNTMGGLLKQYSGGTPAASESEVNAHFDQAAQAAPPETMVGGLAAAFRSDQTPPFSQMVAQLFGNSGGAEKAGVLNSLLSSVGPGLLSQVLSSGGNSGLASLFAGKMQLSPEEASQVPPDAVQQLAQHAEKQSPSIIESISSIYSQHPALIKTLGAGALAVAMAHFSKRAGA